MIGKLRKNSLCEGVTIPIFTAQNKENRRVGRVPAICEVKVACPAKGGKEGGLEMHIVYILKSKKKNRYYVGCTSNLDRRIDEHNNGKVKSTNGYTP